MGQVDFVVVGTLGNYLGKNGKIEIWEFDLYLQRLPIKLIRKNGEVEEIVCSFKLTELIKSVKSVLNYLPYFEVIETTLGRKSISINRVSENSLNLQDYAMIIHSLEETSEFFRKHFENE